MVENLDMRHEFDMPHECHLTVRIPVATWERLARIDRPIHFSSELHCALHSGKEKGRDRESDACRPPPDEVTTISRASRREGRNLASVSTIRV